MAEPYRECAAAHAAALLLELLEVLEWEQAALLALNEPLLAESGSASQRLFVTLQGCVNPAELTPEQSTELSGLLDQVSRRRERNRYLLEQAAARLEAELQQLSHRKRVLQAYSNSGRTEMNPDMEVFLRHDC